jgi:hypothetical protein
MGRRSESFHVAYRHFALPQMLHTSRLRDNAAIIARSRGRVRTRELEKDSSAFSGIPAEPSRLS